jgi:CRP/FNR family transcriptional regulator, polysaccharide utilization system transcription regulator
MLSLPLFKSLTADQEEKIRNNSFVVNHKKGESIYSEGKPISYLLILSEGLVKIFKKEQNGRSVIVRIVSPGNFIGLLSTFQGIRYQFSAGALDDSTLFYVSRQVINEIIRENGLFAMQVIEQFCNDGTEIINRLVTFPQKQVPGRIAEVLLYFGTKVYCNDQFLLPLSRQELADLVYSTKESVSRTLTEFKHDRMIEIDDREVTLKSIDLLKILSKLG